MWKENRHERTGCNFTPDTHHLCYGSCYISHLVHFMIWLVRGNIAYVAGTAIAAAFNIPEVFTVRTTMLLGLFLLLGIGLIDYLRRRDDMATED